LFPRPSALSFVYRVFRRARCDSTRWSCEGGRSHENPNRSAFLLHGSGCFPIVFSRRALRSLCSRKLIVRSRKSSAPVAQAPFKFWVANEQIGGHPSNRTVLASPCAKRVDFGLRNPASSKDKRRQTAATLPGKQAQKLH
jgi:hypothetical protein